ncbi:uncharacterized protein LOC126816198 [Patella vulgata]|uniref:uncharacterized protein LOC126816198 n=1 Tax=Patella vulgata TaxID=6465 RepID=UPI00217F47F5|nr:uncharacterized protein LOC126816198 [Patella vulgata]
MGLTCGILINKFYKENRNRNRITKMSLVSSHKVWYLVLLVCGCLLFIQQGWLDTRYWKISNKHPLKILSDPKENRSAELLLVLFTTWKMDPDKTTVHTNTFLNWKKFKPHVQPVVFSNESAVIAQAIEYGWKYLPLLHMSPYNVPILKYMYIQIKHKYRSRFYAYVNSDILFDDGLIKTITAVNSAPSLPKNEPLLIIGQRTNVLNVTLAESSTFQKLHSISKRGQLFATNAEDYFITDHSFPWETIPELAIGLPTYDNWLVLFARTGNMTVIDCTATMLAVHQTTKKGNKESHSHDHNNYNLEVINKVYKTVDYGGGYTDCTNWITRYNGTSKLVTFLQRPTPACQLILIPKTKQNT